MPKCHNCNSPYHYSDHCTKPKKSSKSCFNCGESGHYRDRCTKTKTTSNSVLQQIQLNHKGFSIDDIQPVEFTILLDGAWGKKSYFLHPNSEFFKVKKELCSKLLELKIIKDEDMDTRNQIPHIETDTPIEFENKKINISISSFIIGRNLVQIDVGRGKHITLIYKTNIGNQKEILIDIFNSFLQQYSKSEETSSQCSICMDSNKDVVLEPCNHFSICNNCAKRISHCPICRVKIENIKIIFNS